MKKIFLMLALVAMAFVSCSEDDELNIENLQERMVGKWMLSQLDGVDLPTNGKIVYTIESPTSGYVSASMVGYSETNPRWTYKAPCNVSVENNKIIVSGNINKTTTFVAEFDIKSFSDTEMLAYVENTTYRNGEPVNVNTGTTMWKRVEEDFSTDILGLWEGRVTSDDGSEFDDGGLHRWEYLADGTYVYYSLDADSNWNSEVNTFAAYFVDGTLLCTRWKNGGEEVENREWWEIASIVDGVMNWTALRQQDDGTTYTATFQMTKVQ